MVARTNEVCVYRNKMMNTAKVRNIHSQMRLRERERDRERENKQNRKEKRKKRRARGNTR